MELHFPILLDGATGTELQHRGLPAGISAEQWVLEHPKAICDLHDRYIKAGSQILFAPTFGANRVKLEEYGIFNQTYQYNRELARIAKENADGRAYIAGDMSPTGKFLAPLGDMSFEELVEIYTEQAQALEDAGVDLYVIETMMTVPEARAAVIAVQSVSSKPILVSFTCDENGRTVMGTDVAAALVTMQSMGVDAFGLNCSTGPDQMIRQIRRLREFAEVPLIAKPNAGLPQVRDGETFYDCPPDEFAEWTSEFAVSGVGIYGGCCGTTPEHITALSHALEYVSFERPQPIDRKTLAATTERDLYLLPAELPIGRIIPCDEQLEDAIEEVMDDEDALLVCVEIRSETELDALADVQYNISLPLCILCNDADVLEQALRIYQGRAIYAGSLPEEQLVPLARRYGLII